jgi:hypothetical protein
MSTYKKYFFVLGSIYNKTFKMKIVITEEERKHILSSHSFNDSFIKNNLREALDKSNGIYTTETDQIVVGILTDNKGMRVKIPAGTKVWHDYTKTDTTKIYLGNTGYVYYCDFKGYKNVLIDEKKNGAWTNDPLTTRIRETFCNGNKIKTWRELTKGYQQSDTENPKDGLKDDPKCKTKNLRNALCDGTWPIKTPEQIQACKTKCAAIPCQPGQICPQVQGWFFSKDRGCYEATGTGGFASKAECEACKCGSKNNLDQGGNIPGGGDKKPGDGTIPGEGGQKLPDFIPPTIVKPSKPLD